VAQLFLVRPMLSARRNRQFASNDEFYTFVDRIAERLRLHGFTSDAERLHTLIHKVAWTTSTELFGELRIALRQTQEEGTLRDKALAYDISLAIDTLDHALSVRTSSASSHTNRPNQAMQRTAPRSDA